MAPTTEISKLTSVLDDLAMFGALPTSYSRANITIVCPRQYHLRYVERTPGGTPLRSEPARVGKFIHTVMQYCIEKGDAFGFTDEDVDFDLIWHQTAKSYNLSVAEYNMAQTMRTETRNVLSRFLRTIRERQLSPMPEVKVTMNKAYEVKRNTKYENRVFTGSIDLLAFSANRNRAILVDYKTHRRSEDRAEEVALQTAIYSLFTFLRYPETQLIQAGCAYIPDEDVDLTTKFDRDRDFPFLVDKVTDFFSKVRDVHQNAPEVGMPPLKSKYCDWCGFINGCPLHQAKTKTKTKITPKAKSKANEKTKST